MHYGRYGAKNITSVMHYGRYGAKKITSVMHYGRYGAKNITSVMHYGRYEICSITSVMHYGRITDVMPPAHCALLRKIYALQRLQTWHDGQVPCQQGLSLFSANLDNHNPRYNDLSQHYGRYYYVAPPQKWPFFGLNLAP